MAGEQGLRLPKAVSGEARIRARLFGEFHFKPCPLAKNADYRRPDGLDRRLLQGQSRGKGTSIEAVLIYDGYVVRFKREGWNQVDSGEVAGYAAERDQSAGAMAWHRIPLRAGTFRRKPRQGQNHRLSGTPQARPEVYIIPELHGGGSQGRYGKTCPG